MYYHNTAYSIIILINKFYSLTYLEYVYLEELKQANASLSDCLDNIRGELCQPRD